MAIGRINSLNETGSVYYCRGATQKYQKAGMAEFFAIYMLGGSPWLGECPSGCARTGRMSV